MRTVFRLLFVAASLFFALPLYAQRSGNTKDPTVNKGEGLEMTRSDLDKIRNNSQDKKSRQVDIYIFAASFSLIDSVLYVSDIQKIDDVTVNNKWFLKDRMAFESQFRDYVQTGDDESQLSSICFSEKQKKVERDRARLIRRNDKKNRFVLKEVSGFRFSKPTADSSN